MPVGEVTGFWYLVAMRLPTCSPRPGRVILLPFLLLLTAFPAFTPGLRAETASQLYAQGVEAYNQGDAVGAQHKLQLALEVDRNFRPANLLLAKMAAEKRQATAPAAVGMSVKVLERTVVPVEFSNTTLDSALEYIRQKALEDSGGKVAINFAVNLPPELVNKRVTLKMDHVPVPELLRYIGEIAGVSFDRQPYAIVVTPAAAKPKAEAANPAAAPAS